MALKIFKTIYIYLCLAIIALGVLVFGYLLTIDGTYVNIPIRTDKWVVQTEYDVYKAGDQIAIKWEYCKGVDTVSDISITLVDGIVYFLPMIHSDRGIGCYNSYTAITNLPKAIPAGTYHLTANIHFEVNSVKSVDYKVTSNNFIVR
jgi:hypothetical protein